MGTFLSDSFLLRLDGRALTLVKQGLSFKHLRASTPLIYKRDGIFLKIQWALCFLKGRAGNRMGVDHGGSHIAMSQ